LGAPINTLRSSFAVSADWPTFARLYFGATTTNAWSAELLAALLKRTCITFSRVRPEERTSRRTWSLCATAATLPIIQSSQEAVRLALWLDRRRAIPDVSRNFGAALRLFGLERFRDGLLPVVKAALSGQSVLVVCPTGFGKSLCFQLPAILRSGVSVVVSPLKALMGETSFCSP